MDEVFGYIHAHGVLMTISTRAMVKGENNMHDVRTSVRETRRSRGSTACCGVFNLLFFGATAVSTQPQGTSWCLEASHPQTKEISVRIVIIMEYLKTFLPQKKYLLPHLRGFQIYNVAEM